MIKKLEEALKGLLPKDDSREPLVLQHAICNEIASEIIRIGGGESRFPFTEIAIQLYAPDDKQQAIYGASFIENQRLEKIIREHLRSQQCRVPDHLVIRAQIVRTAPPEWLERGFEIDYSRPNEEDLPPLRLTILKGVARQASYQFTKPVINIGRTEEAKDKYGVLQMRNDLVFADVNNEINRTLSRRHARIEYDKQSREYRLFDQQSKHGTRVERDGKFLEVIGPRGVALRHSDVIHLGQARLRVEIAGQPNAKIIQ